MWPFCESSLDKRFREKDERWEKAKARVKDSDTLICIISGHHVLYKNKKGVVKSFDLKEGV